MTYIQLKLYKNDDWQMSPLHIVYVVEIAYSKKTHALNAKTTQLESLMSTGAKVQYRTRIPTYYDDKNSEVDQSASTHFSYSSVQNECMNEILQNVSMVFVIISS